MAGEAFVGAFMAIWVGLGIAGFLLFYVGRNASFKKRYFPVFAVLTGLIFLGFIASQAPEALLFAGPAVALITFLNIRSMRFCEACGRTVMHQMPWAAVDFCSGCGARLDGGRERS